MLTAFRDSLTAFAEQYFTEYSSFAYGKFSERNLSIVDFYNHCRYRTEYIKQISFYTEDYAYISGYSPGGMVSETAVSGALRMALQNEIFSTFYAYRFLNDGKELFPVLFLINPENSGTDSLHYAAIVFDLPFFSSFFLNFDDIRVQLINRNFQVLYDSKYIENPYNTLLNEITEKMVDGKTDIETYASQRTAYSSIKVFPERIFIALSQEQNTALEGLSGFSNLLLLAFFLLMLASFVVAWYTNKLVAGFGESLLVSDRYTKDMLFFRRLLKTIERVRKNLPALEEIRSDVNFLYNDLEVIQEKSPIGKGDSKILSGKKRRNEQAKSKKRPKNDK